MSTFENYQKEQLKNEEYRKEYYKIRFFSEIGVQIIKLRIKHNLTQAALAEKAGTTQAVVSRIENGSVSATVGTIQKLAAAMDAVVNIEFKPMEEFIPVDEPGKAIPAMINDAEKDKLKTKRRPYFNFENFETLYSMNDIEPQPCNNFFLKTEYKVKDAEKVLA